MANICDNKFFISCDNADTLDKIADKLEKLFQTDLDGEIAWQDDTLMEGYFDSRWAFPDHLFENFFDEFDDETIYMRCLSEEYGCGLVSMNIYQDKAWRQPQHFDL